MKLLLVLAFCFAFGYAGSENGLCQEDRANLECLKNNFDSLYRENHSQFNKIIKAAEKIAISSANPETLKTFLELGKFIKGNAEVAEYFLEITEKLCIETPQKLFDAVVLLDKESTDDLFFFLRDPIYHDRQEIDNAIKSIKKEKKYKRVIERFYEPPKYNMPSDSITGN